MSGLIDWWQDTFGKLPAGGKNEADLLAQTPPEPPTPLPPNRPMGAEIADIQDAVQEFLTDWLVRRDYDEALDFVSNRGLGCVRLGDETRSESLSPVQVREILRNNMRAFLHNRDIRQQRTG